MLSFFLAFCFCLLATGFLLTAGYCIFLWLVESNIFWSSVEEGWCRIVLRWRGYEKIIEPGLHWIGIPGVYSLYSRKMTFLKGVIKEDGTVTVEAHKDENITSFKTTRYPYALPFKDEEDCRGLPLSGVLVVWGRMEDGYKMFFETSDWYATIVFLALARLRDAITGISYEEITGQYDDSDAAKKAAKKAITQLLWEKMNEPREEGKLSVVDELLQTYGIAVDSVELASIDPPPEWRATTLAPYKARKEREAAEEQAKTSATLFDDTNQALEAWKKTHPKASPAQITEKQHELARRAYLKAGGQYQEIHGLEGANVVGFGGGGGGFGAFVGTGAGNKPGKNSGGQGNPKGGNPGSGQKDVSQLAEEHFRQNGKYPPWDPLKRTPN